MKTSAKREFFGLLAIVVILFSTQGYSLYHSLTTHVALTVAHYVGFAATGLVATTLWIGRSWFCYCLGAVLLLGTDNYVAFAPVLSSIKYYVAGQTTPVQVQTYSFMLLLMWFIFSYGRLQGLVRAVHTR